MTYNYYITNNNLNLNVKTHNVKNPQAVLIHIHGLGGHFQAKYNKYDSLEYRITMCASDIISYGFELRGHGKSEGDRFMIDCFDKYIDDLDKLVEYISRVHHSLQIFIIGCSMGGAICISYSIKYPNKISGIILLAPMTGLSNELDKSWVKMKIIIGIAYLFPSYKMISISTNERYIDEYMTYKSQCPYQNKEWIRLDTSIECYYTMRWIQDNSHLLTIPVLSFHSKLDRTTSYKTTVDFIKKCSSTDKTNILLESGRHNLLVPTDIDDTQPDKILHTINQWLNNRINRTL